VNSKFKVQIKKAKEKGRRNIKEKGKTLPGPAAINLAHFLLTPHGPTPCPACATRSPTIHSFFTRGLLPSLRLGTNGRVQDVRRAAPYLLAPHTLWQVGPSCRRFLLPALARTDEHAVSSARFSGTVQQPWTGSRGKVGA
jgi:hypothetical protein